MFSSSNTVFIFFMVIGEFFVYHVHPLHDHLVPLAYNPQHLPLLLLVTTTKYFYLHVSKSVGKARYAQAWVTWSPRTIDQRLNGFCLTV